MVRIYAPNEGFSGRRAGVDFRNGVADADQNQPLDYFRRHGYRIEGDENPYLDADYKARLESNPVHIGGGWYEVPGLSDPVRGKDEAEEAARQLRESE